MRREKYLIAKLPKVGREDLPDQTCVECETIFKPHRKGLTYCSMKCTNAVASRAYKLRRKLAKTNVVYLTPEIFDSWFQDAA